MNKTTSEKIIFLNFIMTCLMVCYHTISLHEGFALNVWDLRFSRGIGYIFAVMGNYAMCYFFFVSAYLLFRKYELRNYSTKVKKRITSLLIPYLSWQVIITIIDVLQKQYVFNGPDILARTFLLQKFPQDGPLWYVLAIFFLAVISPIFLFILKEKRQGWLCIVLITVLIYLLFRLPFQIIKDFLGVGLMDNVLSYLPCYLVGAYFGRYEKELNVQKCVQYVLSLVCVAFILEGFIPNFLVNITKNMLPILVFYLMPSIKNFKMRKVYNLTFLIYAIHQPLMNDLWDNFLGDFCVKHRPSILLYNVVSKIGMLALTISLAALVYYILSRIFPKALEVLTGGRQLITQRKIEGN